VPEFDIDAALAVKPVQDPVPTCPRCNERMVMDSCDVMNQEGFSGKRVCNFVCESVACDVPENEDRGVWMTEELVVATVTCDLEPMGHSAMSCVTSGRCPWCRSTRGPAHTHIYQHASGLPWTETAGLYLRWECEDCDHHWEEHLGVPDA